jgi:uncharacterized protein
MKVRIREVLTTGLDYSDQVMPQAIDVPEDFADMDTPVVVNGRFERVDGMILARLDVRYAVNIVCARCLERRHQDIEVSFDFDFELKPGDEYIDVGARIREEILLGADVRALCRDECRGICPDCGADLNKEACKCGNNQD